MALNDTKNSTLDLLGFEATSVDDSYTDVSQMTQIKASDLEVGATFTGRPEISFWVNDELDEKGEFKKNYDAIRVRLIDNPEYLDAWMNIPKPDKDGFITNIRQGYNFFRPTFDVIFSFLRYIDETNVIDPKTGDEIKKIKKINIENLVDILNEKELIELEITAGDSESEYNSFMIRKMVDEFQV